MQTSTVELVYATLENSSECEDASAVVLYYAGTPERDQVKEDLRGLRGKLGLSVDVDEERPGLQWGYAEYPTPVSKRAELTRYECGPSG